MMLRDQMVSQGRWLFRWRSFLPLALLPLVLAALFDAGADADRWPGEEGAAIWVWCCFLIAIVGQSIRPLVVGYAPPGTSGRNTKAQKADALNTTGFYSICRHPLYLANFIVFVGIVLAVRVWWVLPIGVLIYWIYYERIAAAEEAFLHQKFGPAFEDWATATPAFVPAVRRWQPCTRSFSWKTVLGREFHGYFAIISVFFVLDAVKFLAVEGATPATWLRTASAWPTLFIVGAFVFLIFCILKKKTSVFSN